MANPMIIYAVCFDISDDRSRRNVGKALLEYGDRVQYSVFEVAFKRVSQLQDLISCLKPFMEEGDDIRFYRLCRSCRSASQSLSGAQIGQWPAAILVS
ncbi:CRISPR-associated endonuclease Cas2 [Alteromonas gilva]|uniref:CRISPR-associated endoribonuclease Cas2 n=1 Tax=Alteromonas gilva TaxID=2987522 RepID=A0ABT5L4U8_9ALTE|nr:CRISPR-associated endonuclease Cas2 [Alteromonas gilva]MDC8832065.1 CRISPR-associated endonuclease Cas2 [Alteromonas gilva]